jgi:glycosyltransferase involved in cell wall biosynthesis
MKAGDLIFDLTSSWSWTRPAVGVIRTEREIARALIASGMTNLRFCVYLATFDTFAELSMDEVEAHLSGEQTGRKFARSSSTLPLITFTPDDWYLSVGLDWDDKNLDTLYERKKAIGFSVALFCHDVIAVRQPHLCLDRVAKRFPHYLYQLAWCADLVFCNSESTRADLRDFLQDIKARMPMLKTVRLGSVPPMVPNAIRDGRIRELMATPYLLYVSTIEARKNHLMLLTAYLKMADEMENAPKLVCVGVPAWGSEPFFKLLKSDPRAEGQVFVLEEVGDEDLEHLYRSCLFTVYPSICEGWGLPVVESLARGKFCLVSNTTSMPEAGGEWCEYVDPFNPIVWCKKMAEYVGHPDRLELKQSNIRTGFRPSSWTDLVKSMVDHLPRREGAPQAAGKSTISGS